MRLGFALDPVYVCLFMYVSYVSGVKYEDTCPDNNQGKMRIKTLYVNFEEGLKSSYSYAKFQEHTNLFDSQKVYASEYNWTASLINNFE